MSLRHMIQGMAHELADARHGFERSWFFNRRRKRDELLTATAYGVQNCLRSLAMLHPGGASPDLKYAVATYRKNLASGIETEGHDPAEGHGAQHESPTAEGGDAQPEPSS